jgi:hypothetical protein
LDALTGTHVIDGDPEELAVSVETACPGAHAPLMPRSSAPVAAPTPSAPSLRSAPWQQIMASVIAAGDASRGLGSRTRVFHCPIRRRPGARGREARRPARPLRGRCGSPAGRLLYPCSPGTATRSRRRVDRPCPRRADRGSGRGRRAADPSAWSAATRALRLLISSAMVAAESASCSSRTLVQTTAFHVGGRRRVAKAFADHEHRRARLARHALAGTPRPPGSSRQPGGILSPKNGRSRS